MVTYDEWETSLTETQAGYSNSFKSVGYAMKVGNSRTLIIFEIGSVVGSDQMRELITGAARGDRDGVIYNAKPGIWVLLESSGSEEAPFCATWVSEGHIDYGSLPQEPLVSPLNLDGLEWRKVHEEYFNSTVGCILGLEVAQEFEEVGIDNATSAFADLGGVIPGGFIFGPHESGHEVHVRVDRNQVVQIKVCWDE
uniref:Uncharacterized protein n=1 Tax=Psilocybe cubensis TaxID=181762 RepID=A0A8H7XJW3_PSICU